MARKKYGYKPKALRLRGFSVRDVLGLVFDPAVRVFKQGIGIDVGEVKAGRNVPWAGATTGAETTDEAIRMLKSVSPGVGARAESFAAESGAYRGIKGLVWVRDVKGRVYPISRAAFDRHKAGMDRAGKGLEIAPSPVARVPLYA